MTQSTIITILKHGGIGVLPTDTIYGIVGSALSKKAVARVYHVKKRNPHKPCIILIGSFADLKKLNIHLTRKEYLYLRTLWPSRISVILPCLSSAMRYLHCKTYTLALRFPKKPSLVSLLKKTGPLIAPSANPESKKPAQTISETKKYFGKTVDFYINGGKKDIVPSTLLLLNNGNVQVLRVGKELMKP